MAGPSEAPEFSVNDVLQHVETYGVDLFPILDLPMENVKFQALFSELRDRWPHLYQNMITGGAGFAVAAAIELGGGQKVVIPTFTVNNRGPVFTFPRHLPPNHDVDLGGERPAEVFQEAFDIFLKTFLGRQILRLGVVRELMLGTGHTDCTAWLGERVLEFDSGRLEGAQCTLVYQDDEHNYRIQLAPAQMMQSTPVPATGQVMTRPDQFGLAVSLDVNNRDAHPLTAEEMQAVMARASELWPDSLLNFLNHRRFS